MSRVPRWFRSTDPGAPALTGLAGSLAEVLDAVLVDGYGSGLDEVEPAGWTRELMATNKRVYRNDPVLGSGYFLRVDDTATVGNARHVFVTGFGAMTDIDSGSDRFPAAGNGSLWPKSTALSGASRPWSIIASSTFFYLFVSIDNGGTGNFSGVPYAPYFAGDIVSLVPGDRTAFMILGTNLTTYTGSTVTRAGLVVAGNNFDVAPSDLAVLALNYDGSSVSAPTGLVIFGDSYTTSDTAVSNVGGGSSRPGGINQVTQGFTFARVHVTEGPHLIRGYMPNMLAPIQRYPYPHGVIQEGVEGFPPSTQLLPHLHSAYWPNPSPNWSEAGMALFDLSNEWVA